jgi:hypothetical protein
MDQPTEVRTERRRTTSIPVQVERWFRQHETRVEVVALALALLFLFVGRLLDFGPLVFLGVVSGVSAFLTFLVGTALDIRRDVVTRR